MYRRAISADGTNAIRSRHNACHKKRRKQALTELHRAAIFTGVQTKHPWQPPPPGTIPSLSDKTPPFMPYFRSLLYVINTFRHSLVYYISNWTNIIRGLIIKDKLKKARDFGRTVVCWTLISLLVSLQVYSVESGFHLFHLYLYAVALLSSGPASAWRCWVNLLMDNAPVIVNIQQHDTSWYETVSWRLWIWAVCDAAITESERACIVLKL